MVSWAADRLDVFLADDDGQTWHKYWDGSNWHPKKGNQLEKLGKPVIYSELTAVSWGPKRLDAVGRGEDGTYLHLYWDGHQWTGWEDVWGAPADGVKFASPPAAVSWGPDRLDVFGVGDDNKVYHKYWNGEQYLPSEGWELLAWKAPEGGFNAGALQATSWGPNRLDLWAVGHEDGALWHTLWDHDYYGPWESLGGSHFVEAPAVAHWAPNRIDILVQDWQTNEYQYKFWDGYGWRPDAAGWYPKGEFASEPAVTTWGPNNLNILGLGAEEGALLWQAWNQTEWVPSADGYVTIGNFSVPKKDAKLAAWKHKAAGKVATAEDTLMRKVMNGGKTAEEQTLMQKVMNGVKIDM